MNPQDPYRLNRFLNAQDSVYRCALSEIKRGRKVSHWMWFIFPQIEGLGYSDTACFYAISGIEEAKAYMDHPILRRRYEECCQALYEIEGKSSIDIFGYTDSMKLCSSLTLFYLATSYPLYKQLIDKYYDGEMCEFTVSAIKES